MSKQRSGSNKSASRKRIQQRRAAEKRRKRIIQIILTVAGITVLSSYIYSIVTRPQALPVSQNRLENYPSKGSDDALVTITEFGDFACPICQTAFREKFLEQLLDQYGDLIRVEWRDLPVYTPKAAQAGQCAHDQGLFWEFHDIAFENAPALGVKDLKIYAAQIGLEMEQFNQCLDSGQHSLTVSTNNQAANGMGLRGTPSFVVNGTPVVGYDKNTIYALIEAALATTN